MSAEVKACIFSWFDLVDTELMDRICEGCGRYPTWRTTVIDGCMKKLRRDGETYAVSMHIQLNESSIVPISVDLQSDSPPNNYLYSTNGNGDMTLPMMPPPSRPPSANAVHYLSPALGYSLTALMPEIDSPQGLQLSSAYGKNHVGPVSNQPLESASSRDFNDLTYLDPEYLSDDWYLGQWPLLDWL